MTQQKDASWFADGEAYEHYVGRWSRPVGRMFLDWLNLPRDLRWADVGCGTGVLTGMILDRAAPNRVVGVEPSEGFFNLARMNVEDRRAEFRLGDAQSLPLDSQEADVAVSDLVLNFVPDKNRALQEMRRVVNPGSTVAAYVWDYAGEMQLMRYFWTAVVELFPDGAEKDEGKQFPICKPNTLAELFRAGGMQGVKTQNLDAPTVFKDFEDYWSPFLRGQGPAGAYCVSLSEHDRDRLRTRLENVLPFNNDGTISLISRAWAVRGTV
jgi:SAM-dependent methyltransferase